MDEEGEKGKVEQEAGEPEEIPRKRKRRKPVKVRLVRHKNQAALVEWRGKKGSLRRGIVPLKQVADDGKVDAAQLEMAIPYGDPFAEMVGEMRATPAELEAQLHQAGIWTVDDLLGNTGAARGAIQAAYGMDLAALLRAAQAHKRKR